MPRSSITVLAWLLSLLAVVFAWGGNVAAVWLDGWQGLEPVGEALFLILLVVPAVAGALIASRLPENVTGWLILLLALGFGAESLNNTFNPDEQEIVTSAGWQWFAWATNIVVNTSVYGALTLFLLLFPTGRVVSRRWRPLFWCTWIALSVIAFDLAFGAEFVNTEPSIENPAHIPLIGAISGMASIVEFMVIPIVAIASLTSLVLRFCRASGIERQQLKWFVYISTLIVTSVIASLLLIPLNLGDSELNDTFIFFGLFVGFGLGLPVVVAVAILRYRLYDIDRIINRTLVYGLLTVGLGLSYAALVVGGGGVLRSMTGESNQIIVAVSTLTVAALFRPMRTRIQSVIDQRFFRHKYDAERTLEQFSARLRDEVDLGTLIDELRAVVHETVQPSRVTVWIAPAEQTQ